MGAKHLLNAILLFGIITNISAQEEHLGRLLTPEEGCGISKVVSSKIIGGAPAMNGAYPWMGLIGKRTSNMFGFSSETFVCGGSLITSRHVLTAAHCAIPGLFVRLGEHDITTTTDGAHKDINVIRIVKHPNFNVSFPYSDDIAILTLENDVKFNDRIRPICLPLIKELQLKSFANANAFVAGWGRLQANGQKSKVLMELQLPVMHNLQCEALFRAQGQEPMENQYGNSIICAGNLAGGQDPSVGDSGGPLMLPIFQNDTFLMYQIGLVSIGSGCAREYSPTIYTRISHFMDWIETQINTNRD